MNVAISTDAEQDLEESFWFYERQSMGWGNYFRSCLISDIESLAYFAGVHQIVEGYFLSLAKRFPHGIDYEIREDTVVVVAVLDLRREPLWIRQRLSK